MEKDVPYPRTRVEEEAAGLVRPLEDVVVEVTDDGAQEEFPVLSTRDLVSPSYSSRTCPPRRRKFNV